MKKSITLVLFSLLYIGILCAEQYKMEGPYKIVARDGQYRNTKGGSERDMKKALEFAEAGKHKEAIEIIDAYASMLERLDGHDAPLCAIQCYDLVRAMTIVSRNDAASQQQLDRFNGMIKRALLPMMQKFEADSPYANGNWGAIVNRLRMACAICMKDSVLYKAATDYHLYANDNGSLPKYISETGQCQETGRDQGHVQLGLEALAQICEMAWEQGDDLWGALDNRLLNGFEYTARYNLGYDVPFETWIDCTGLYCEWTEPGQMGRGKLWPIYERAYNHYVKTKGLQMPYTEKMVVLY